VRLDVCMWLDDLAGGSYSGKITMGRTFIMKVVLLVDDVVLGASLSSMSRYHFDMGGKLPRLGSLPPPTDKAEIGTAPSVAETGTLGTYGTLRSTLRLR